MYNLQQVASQQMLDISFMEKIPSNLKCIQCRLTQYEPFYHLKENLCQRHFIVLSPGENYVKTPFHFDLRHKYNDFKNDPSLDVIIICTKIKPTPKKAVNEGPEQHQKKNQIIPQYEWPHPNIFLEWNQNHIKYSMYSFALVPRDIVKAHNTLQFTGGDLKYASFLTAFVVERKKPIELMHKIISRLEKDNSLIEQMQRQYKDAIDRTIRAAQSDQTLVLESPFLSLSLIDPQTYEQLAVPIRGKKCQHLESIDLLRFIESNIEPKDNRWNCPRCLQPIDIDQILLDTIQMKILQNIQKQYPSNCQNIQRVFILDQDLNYKLDENTQSLERNIFKIQCQSNQDNLQILKQQFSFTLMLNNMRREIPSLVTFIDHIFGKNFELIPLTRDEVSRLFLALQETTNFFDLIVDQENAYKAFNAMFDMNDYMNQNLFAQNIDLSEIVTLEQICQQISEFTLGGVYAEFCCYIQSSVQSLVNYLMIPQVFFENYQQKTIELIFAAAYHIKNKQDGYKKYRNKSFGYLIGYLFITQLEKIGKNEDQQLRQNFFLYIKGYISELYLPKLQQNREFFSTSEFLINYFTLHRKGDSVLKLMKLYISDQKNQDESYKLSISILLYNILINLFKDKDKDNLYYIPSGSQIQSEKTFYNIIDQISSHEWDLKSLLKQNNLDFKDYKQAFKKLDDQYNGPEKQKNIIL